MMSDGESTPPALPPKQRLRKAVVGVKAPPQQSVSQKLVESPTKMLPDLLEHTSDEKSASKESVDPCDVDLMEELTVEKYLVKKKEEEEGPDIRGGPIDALIIQATKATKNGG